MDPRSVIVWQRVSVMWTLWSDQGLHCFSIWRTFPWQNTSMRVGCCSVKAENLSNIGDEFVLLRCRFWDPETFVCAHRIMGISVRSRIHNVSLKILRKKHSTLGVFVREYPWLWNSAWHAKCDRWRSKQPLSLIKHTSLTLRSSFGLGVL